MVGAACALRAVQPGARCGAASTAGMWASNWAARTDYADQVTWTIGVLIVCALLLAGWAIWRAVKDQPVILRQLIAGGVIEVGILVQMVVAGVLQAGGHSPTDAFTFWGYLVVSLLVLPAAAVAAVVERTRWSSVVLIVACGTVAVMQLRVHQLWGGL